ncbi:MAG: IS4 family transposase [Egibacteraceae bacterium]
MAHLGQRKLATGERLADHIAVGVLTHTFPPDLVDRVIDATGKREQRVRKLPARVTLYFVLGLCLFAHESYTEVATLLAKGLIWSKTQSRGWTEPSDTALVNARRRLGPEPLQALFAQVAKPLATPQTKGAWYRDWRLVAIDGTTLDVADTPENDERFGRPASSGEDPAAFPQARVVGLVECGTHAVFDAEIGAYTTSETKLAPVCLRSLGKDMLALSDRGFWSFELWTAAAATGADLLWRTKSNIILPVLTQLEDGSYLSQIAASHDRKKHKPVTVRVIEYRLQGRSKETFRLVTTILDPKAAPAAELAALYAERWEIESALKEWKTYQRGRGVVLRSQSPDGVLQEIWAHLLVFYAVRSLMRDAAHEAGLDPDRMSFLNSLRIVRRQVTEPAAFSP